MTDSPLPAIASPMPAIPGLQDHWTALWHRQEPAAPAAEATLTNLLEAQHRANYDLWHTEDRARAPRATPSELAELKHSIDRINQRRNDLTEQIDALLLSELAPLGLPLSTAELHSESPGLMIDRLSILALKLFHTREELVRPDAPPQHAERNRARLAILVEQRDDLALCLNHLWTLVHAGQRRFKIYRQLKMYNDPTLNPVLYTASSQESPTI